jgi:hypothetical protein
LASFFFDAAVVVFFDEEDLDFLEGATSSMSSSLSLMRRTLSKTGKTGEMRKKEGTR